MQLEWEKKNLPSSINVLCCNGNLNGGVFVAVSKYFVCRYMIYSQDGDKIKLKNLLRTLPVDWSCKPIIVFEAVFEKDIGIVEELIASNNRSSSYEAIFNRVWLPPELHHKIDVIPPENTYLDRLNESHVKKVNETWKYGSKDTEAMVKNTICGNLGIGLFRKEDGKLLAWNTMQHFAGLGMLFTDVEERNKGYARIVTAALAKALVEQNVIPFACISEVNKPSMNVFSKLGFVVADRCTWVIVDAIQK
ncbi:uncharacterized protein LOC111056071 isoform X2 [Nilaparvata lugens]|nr:uncharacterized protein LOC111056071 isoform X2 [Nilaparvata lugens]XP_039298231.1 uncharacterized protein LOC111056071 isoform X2 [Nilaparvata lugens]XP_039298238.1 uncharacterized protein LOC111056071 isoform X2 [Nilaparvata lugens]